MEKADIGLVGLAVMGENLVLNMAENGFSVAVYNRTTSRVDEFIEGRAKGKPISGFHSVEELCAAVKRPRKIMLMIKAGVVVDKFIEQVLPHLEAGDILIDGGNSHYSDSERRYSALKEKGIHFIGTGVSGGEEGALTGPSIMPGGAPEAWEQVRPIFQAIAAKVEDGSPCCEWVGNGGAGHFVKMVHNGIEYGDMQLIGEAYHIMKSLLGYSADELHKVFAKWDEGELDSYLTEITAEIFSKKDEETGEPLVEKILDTAGQKGTGKWTAVAALDFGIPVTLIGEAVFSRCLSAQKDERVEASKLFEIERPQFEGDKQALVNDIEKALFAAKIISYAQGFTLLRAAAEECNWALEYGDIALMWRGGCIIRSHFLKHIREAYNANSNLKNLLLDPYFKNTIEKNHEAWRRVVSTAVMHGIPVPALSTALSYFDGYRCGRLPANLLQAQRDFFGAHTYERIDKPRGEYFHTNWTGRGGTTASSTYTV